VTLMIARKVATRSGWGSLSEELPLDNLDKNIVG
jgi:hypothetical protein